MSTAPASLKLHLGCGKRYIQGFVHVDLDDYPHVDHRSRIDQLPMFADGSAELIYCCHAFEYFDCKEAPAVLAEWYRVLAPGGILRLAVPDIEALIVVYQRTGDLNVILGPLYGRMVVQTAAGATPIFHRTIYDFRSIVQLLEAAGFASVQRFDWRRTIHRDHDDFSQAYVPHMDKEHGVLISLNVEAVKPRR